MRFSAISLVASFVLLFPPQHASAVEVLSAKELVSHCNAFPDDSASPDGEFCVRYIQGFIDGAVATDIRVMLNVEQDLKPKSEFVQRALRTRAPQRAELDRAARYAEFCLGDPISLKEVVSNVVADLNQQNDISADTAARDLVYTSLKQHYPCKPK